MNKPRENNIACCAFLFVFLCSSSSFHDASFFFSSFLLFLLTFLYVSISQPLFHRRSPFFLSSLLRLHCSSPCQKFLPFSPVYFYKSFLFLFVRIFSKKKKSIRKIIFLRRLKERRLISRVRKFFQFHHAWWVVI